MIPNSQQKNQGISKKSPTQISNFFNHPVLELRCRSADYTCKLGWFLKIESQGSQAPRALNYAFGQENAKCETFFKNIEI